jgi:hypothetical protein
MEQTECSETSAYKLQTPGNYPKESIQHLEHGESLKSRMINNTDKQLEFKISREENKTIWYLDLSINRNNNMDLNIYRKPMYMDITIHFSSNHPYDHKLADFKYYINRTITMPITEQTVKQEWNEIITMACNNGFPEQTDHKKWRLTNNQKSPTTANATNATKQ